MIFHQPGNSRGNYHIDTKEYSNRSYAPHFHKNLELIILLHGTMEVTVNGTIEQMNAGEAALILSNQIHAFEVPKGSTASVTVFSEDYVPAFSSVIKNKQGTRSCFVPLDSIVKLYLEQIVAGNCTRLMKKACLYALCDQYLQQIELENRQDRTNFLVGKILDWIAMHYTENITLKQAAEEFGYEYHYLSRLLNRNYAINFSGLLNAYRIEYAVNLLQNSDLSITGIAEASGFQSIRSFNHSFKKITGFTPNNYRNNR